MRRAVGRRDRALGLLDSVNEDHSRRSRLFWNRLPFVLGRAAIPSGLGECLGICEGKHRVLPLDLVLEAFLGQAIDRPHLNG